MMKRPTLFTLLLLLITLPALAGKVYKIIDEHGNVTYTDRAPGDQKNAETAKLPFINTQPAPQLQDFNESPNDPGDPKEKEVVFSGYTRLAISAPLDQQTITTGQRSVHVGIALEPALQPDHRVQIIFDGAPKGAPQSTTGFLLTDLHRGSHEIFFRVIDASGATYATSPAVTIFVQRAHINSVLITANDHAKKMATKGISNISPKVTNPFSLAERMKLAQQQQE